MASFFRGVVVRLMLAGLIFFGGGEIASRCYWSHYKGVPFWSSGCLWYAFYPRLQLTGLDSSAVRDSDETYDVLILGGSTVSDEYGTVSSHLRDGLQKRGGRPVRVFNLAYAAHNSRDSLLKYRRVARRHFDLVLAYDGINDTRMNNTPPGKFCSDYSHCGWYASLNFLDAHPWLSRAALPLALEVFGDRLAEELGLVWRVDRLATKDEHMEYAADIRSTDAFAAHYREIIARATEKGDRLVLMTFAYYAPAYYRERNTWGKPAYVAEAIARQNGAIAELAAQNPGMVFVDQQQLMHPSEQTFYDCCHFTETGCMQFVDNILAALDARK